MLQFTHQGQFYQLPLLADTDNKILLEEDDLQVNLVFEVPPTAVQSLYNNTPLLQTEESPLIFLELEINYCTYDFKEKDWVAIGNLSYPLSLEDLAASSLSASILEASTLFLPGYAQPCTLHQLQFGAIQDQQIAFFCQASARDVNGVLDVEIAVPSLPLQEL